MNRPPSCTETFASITPYFIPRSRASWRCLTGNYPRSAIHWWISLITVCAFTCLSRNFADSAAWIPKAIRSPPRRNPWRSIAVCAALRRCRRGIGLTTRPFACSAWPEFCKACWRAPCREMPRAPRRCRRVAEPGRWPSLDGSGYNNRSTYELIQRTAMDFSHSEKVRDLQERITQFMESHVYPAEALYHEELEENRRAGNPWQVTKVLEDLKKKARAAELWNLFLPHSEHGAGLTNLEYAPLCEIMGRSHIAPEAFNCSAPDTGNMEVLARYATKAQQQRWLVPLLACEIRSAFAMTEPRVASSDATNIESSIVRDGDSYVINGRKWWTSGAGDPRCEILIFMGKTNPAAALHSQQSMIL